MPWDARKADAAGFTHRGGDYCAAARHKGAGSQT
ncbi:hypothetical protein CLV67_110318 [Actinoplanes italicus]|uniref:Uncharacterized protein n=1 Tax=Actinoplanes italicus TaxID=113567 RepID=A0A2T0K9V1_9ACTN|nr:hypothetical protein CLV67_110318 [Actinoplanes italicus]